MDTLTQAEVFSLIAQINEFADKADQLVSRARTTYDRNKKSIQTSHTSTLSELDRIYKANCDAISGKSRKAIGDARKMLSEIESLDARLIQADKYYRKTKEKKQEELASVTSSHYQDSSDYFAILARIKQDYLLISKKYSEDILPGLINGLNYFFSSKRKKDYEELIVLLNTLHAFVSEIEDVLPALTADELAHQKSSYSSKRDELVARNQQDNVGIDANYQVVLEKVADQILLALDTILPDDLIHSLAKQVSEYNISRNKVNSTREIENGIINMCFVDYPIDFFVGSPIVSSLIKEKCEPLVIDGNIRLPVSITVKDAPTWFVSTDGKNNTALQTFIHSIMYNALAACPVSKLTFTVYDPENRGNSVAPFFDAKKKLPELFDEQIIVSWDTILEKINAANSYIEDILQNKLGTRYNTIYDYAKADESYPLTTQILVLFDFPKGFDGQGLDGLRNILRNGQRCGIVTIIVHTAAEGSYGEEYTRSIKSIEALSTVIRQNSDVFMMRGMPLVYYSMPDKANFAKFFSKYMLIFEGIKNRGIAFSPLIKKLVDAKSVDTLEKHIADIRSMMENFKKGYAQVPLSVKTFPSNITLGEISYPTDVFSDSMGYEKIVKVFGSQSALRTSAGYVDLPLSLDLRNSFNILFNSPEESASAIQQFTHHIMWSLLSFLPVTKVNFCIMDSEHRGNSILPFLDFRKKSPELFGDKIYTSSESIYEKLQSINSHIDDFIMNKLGSKYRDILEYNIATPARAEPVSLLVLYDFPAGLDGRSIDILQNILRNGNKCGIYTLICYNPSVSFSRYENLDDRLEQLAKYCISIDYKENQFRLLPYNLPIRLPKMMDMGNVSSFVSSYSKEIENVKTRGLSFSEILPECCYGGDTSKVLDIPIGLGDEDAIINLHLGEGTSHHGLIGGGTGGGKSTLLHTIIMSAMMNYSPDQLHLYLMDFKGGTEFSIYKSQRLPHIQLLAIDAMQEFGESILENLIEEMGTRAAAFKNAGGYTKLEDYVNGTGKTMPRILVIMDEFQILFDDTRNRKVAMRSANHAKRIVTEGRAFGIHLLMATQSTNIIGTLALDRGTIEQMRVRIGLKCGEDDARYLFSDRYDRDALEKMVGPKGTAVMNLDYTETYGNIGLRVAFCDNRSKANYLEQISAKFANEPCQTQIFEGSLTEYLLDYLKSEKFSQNNLLPVRIHLGKTIKVAPPFEIVVDRKKKHNLLVCGSDEKMANNILNCYMVSAALNRDVTMYCIDGDTIVGEDQSCDFYSTLGNYCKLNVANSRADIVQFIHDVFETYTARKKTNEKGLIFVVIKNLQFLDLVKSMLKGESVEESEYIEVEDSEPIDSIDDFNPFASVTNLLSSRSSGSMDSGSANEKLLKLIDDGSGFGIHFVVSSLEYQTVRDCMHYGEGTLAKFPERIIFSMNDNDADNLVENVSLAGLMDNIVYFSDGVKEPFQMKPYIAPSISDIQTFFTEV